MDKFLIGNKIRKLRGKKTLSEFAKLCNVSAKTISNIENGKNKFRIETFLKIALGLKMTPKDLFDHILKD